MFRLRALAVTAAVVLAAAVTAGALPATAASPASSLPMGQCTTTSGAIVAVDFSPWGGPIVRGCGSTPTTGYQLLNEGGFHSVGTGSGGPAFVCQIGSTSFAHGTAYGSPSCRQTPPASASWSYWHANPGQSSWTFSTVGAMSYAPKPGSVDLWTFGSTTSGPPTPDSLRAHNTAPIGAPKPTTKPKPPAQSSSHKAGSSHAAPRTKPAGTTDRAATSKAHSTAGSSHPRPTATTPAGANSTGTSTVASAPTASGSPRPSSTGEAIIDAKPAADTHHSSGSAVPTIAGVGLIAVIGVGAWAVRRRRQQS